MQKPAVGCVTIMASVTHKTDAVLKQGGLFYLVDFTPTKVKSYLM